MILLGFIVVVLWALWGLHRLLVYRAHRFTGKTVLITGACSELGACLCHRLYAQGVNLIAWDSNLPDLERLEKALRSSRGSLSGAEGDGSLNPPQSPHREREGGSLTIAMVSLTSPALVQRAVEEFKGPLDVVFHTALGAFPRPSLSRTPDAIGGLLLANAAAPLSLAKLLRRREGGHFVSFLPFPGVDEENPELAASHWAAVGMHYSIRAWLKNEEKPPHGAGRVYTTLVYLPAWKAEVGRVSKRPVGLSDVESSRVAEGNAHETKVLNAEVDAALYAVARHEESYSGRQGWLMILRAMMLMTLPFPWQTSLDKICRQVKRPQRSKNA
ncbi:unnamed protein product [Phytomonas sp. Hart1]|nr:unnamed protein product [Phytomonas sp. Hart1]|eukprot:CCW66935.1 unnamed protein product [Phytomonas sp. isolate Hart1]